MGRIRACARASSLSPLLLDVFALAVVLFSGVDVLVFPRERLCAEEDLASELLPHSVRVLLDAWPSLAPQLSEWMLQMIADGATDAGRKAVLSRCLPAFKHAEKYAEASMWARLVPIE